MTHTTRPSWPEIGLQLAQVIATRAACTRSQVGAAVISKDRKQIFLGYNGVPSGELHCSEGGCPRGMMSFAECPPYGGYANCKAVHAEANALMRAGEAAEQGLLCITRSPCDDCQKMITEYKIAEVVYL